MFFPRGGWSRAGRYVVYRLRRLPDPSYRISRGIGAGVFACFTPLFGAHFVTAALVTWAIRGNMLAAFLATFFGNPLTFPFIATLSVGIGTWVLGLPPVPPHEIFVGFSLTSVEIGDNLVAVFTSATVEWERTGSFLRYIFLPYAVGGLLPGAIFGTLAFYVSDPIIASYQRGRIRRLKQRFEAKRRQAQASRDGRKSVSNFADAPLEAE